MTQYYIHIGFGKTATTWLQNLIFNRNKNINYLGKTEQDYPKWLIEWHYLDDYAFNKEKDNIRNIVESMSSPDKMNLLSSEAFTRFGGVSFNQAARIREICRDARILIILRDPIAILKSFYKNNVQEGLFTLDLEDYLDWTRTPFVLYKRKPAYLPDLFFSETVETYMELFGENNVCILRYEDMLSDTDKFFGQLSGFLGVDFDLQYIKNALSTRINESIKENCLGEKRASSFFSYLTNYFPSVAGKVKVLDIEQDTDNELMSKELENKLKDYFKYKCYGYY